MLTKVLGWKIGSEPAPADKCIILGAPHTSMWDFVVAYLFYKSFDMATHCMIKAPLFKGPLGFVLRKMGGIPVDQTNRATMVRSVISEFEKHEVFHLAIAPEGTRKPVKKWARGYHIIAKAVGCKVFKCYFDWGTKTVGVGPEFVLTEDSVADTVRLQQEYDQMGLVGKHPELYITK
ncbi:MAG: 1-acyl-sn-glycerol-3-phosphate acyltransferase [Bacteroidales bacterium]|nr:1-acyl-sn-glycerol-3-phosphate acyltransferase [Bacteroidales bacterium]